MKEDTEELDLDVDVDVATKETLIIHLHASTIGTNINPTRTYGLWSR